MLGRSAAGDRLLRPIHDGQLAALQDEDAIRALGEDILPGAPRPVLMPLIEVSGFGHCATS